MKTKFFFLLVLFMGIGALTYAQTQTAAPAESKDANTQVVAPDHAKPAIVQGMQQWVPNLIANGWMPIATENATPAEKQKKNARKPASPLPLQLHRNQAVLQPALMLRIAVNLQGLLLQKTSRKRIVFCFSLISVG